MAKSAVKLILESAESDQLLNVIEKVFISAKNYTSRADLLSSLETLEGILEIATQKNDVELGKILRDVQNELCLHLFFRFQENASNDRELIRLICAVNSLCTNYFGADEVFRLATKCEEDLKIYCESVKSSSEVPAGCLNPSLCLEILKFIFDNSLSVVDISDFKIFLNNFQNVLDEIFTCCEEEIGALILIQIIPHMLRLYDDEEKTALVQKLWEKMQSFFTFNYSDCKTKSVGTAFLILCNLIEYCVTYKLIPQSSLFKIYAQNNFWHLIQLGLTHENSLNRKRVLYVLKQIVDNFENNSPFNSDENVMFMCENKDKKVLWNNYLLIMETLEEKQVHVIKPVLSRFEELVKRNRNSSNLYQNSLHISWIVTAYQRMFIHEAKFVKKWAILHCLEITFSQHEIINENISEFIFVPLLSSLNDGSLFARSQQELRSSLPSVANAISEFLIRCSHQLNANDFCETFFCSFLHHILCLKWSSVPLLYICRSLSTLPSLPVWNSSAICDLRQLTVEPLRTQEKFLRVAIHCYLFEAFLKLVKVDELSLTEFSFVLVPFVRDSALRRDTQLWDLCTRWLQDTVNKGLIRLEDVLLFSETMANELSDFSQISKNVSFVNDAIPERFARMLLLFLDAKLLFVHDVNRSVASIFQSVTDILCTMNSRAYLPRGVVDRCLQFITALLEGIQHSRKMNEEDLVNISIRKWLLPSMTSITDYIVKQISSEIIKIEDVDRLDMILRLLTIISKVFGRDGLLCECINKIAERSYEDIVPCIQQPNHAQLKKFVAVKCLAWIAKTLNENDGSGDYWNRSKCIIIEFVRLLNSHNMLSEPMKKWDSIHTDKDTDKVLLNQWGRMVSDYIFSVWNCVLFCLNQCPGEIDEITLTESALLSVEIGTDVIPAICPCLKLLLPNIFNRDKILFERVFNCVWNSSFERRKTEAFWNGIDAFLDMTYQPALLDKSSNSVLQKYCSEAHLLSDTCPTVFCSLVFHCCSIWSKFPDIRFIRHHSRMIAHALTFGPVHRKDQKVGYEAAGYIYCLGSDCGVNGVIKSEHLDDAIVRACAVSLVLSLREHSFIHQLVSLLLEEDDRITAERSRYYANSFIHLKKNRIWQSLLILEPMCSQDVITELLQRVYVELMKEGSQLSIRLMQEWLAVRILERFHALRCDLWDQVKKAGDVRVGSVGSFLAIICHTAKLVHDKDFMVSAISCTLPWCLAQNFNTRVTAQVVLNQLWEVCEVCGFEDILDKYCAVKSCLDFTCQSGNASRYIQKLMNDFYFNVFDGLRHYTLQTLFYEIPRLTHVTDQEWIPPDLFFKFSFTDKESIKINTYNENDILSRCEGTLTKDIDGESFDNEMEILSGNVQKKITPWRQLLSDQGTLFDSGDGAKKSDLIVVASLIDRIPNLGGLCRSCEIFGANEYVLNSIKCIDDKQFQNLSVSAEKWLTISEVKPFQLRDYLLAMRNKGYTLIGAEQTANSIKLHEYKFPQKSLLLLGNEKEGIPVSLIQLLDVCVEIPQQGVVRSLNVHVSGAVIIWEYARQHFVDTD